MAQGAETARGGEEAAAAGLPEGLLPGGALSERGGEGEGRRGGEEGRGGGEEGRRGGEEGRRGGGEGEDWRKRQEKKEGRAGACSELGRGGVLAPLFASLAGGL